MMMTFPAFSKDFLSKNAYYYLDIVKMPFEISKVKVMGIFYLDCMKDRAVAFLCSLIWKMHF